MAKPISYKVPTRDDRHETPDDFLHELVDNHGDAIKSACEVLQLLHDRGVLELIRGALGSGDKVLEIAVENANKPESIRSIRNLLLMSNLIGELDPEILKAFTAAVPRALKSIGEQEKPPSLFRMATDLMGNPNMRRGLSAMNAVVEALGSELAAKPD